MDTPVADLKLPLRIVNIFEARSIIHVPELLRLSREDLEQIANMGERTICAVDSALRKLGVEPPPWLVDAPSPSKSMWTSWA